MVPGVLRQLSGYPGLGLGFKPGGVEKLDEREGEHDQHEDHAGKEDDQRKQLANIRVERDVPESKRGHDRQCPIKTSDPAVLLVFQDHQKMKQDAIDGDHTGQNKQELNQHPNVVFSAFGQKVDELAQQKFHAAPSRATRPAQALS